jgi:hypothetical protein
MSKAGKLVLMAGERGSRFPVLLVILLFCTTCKSLSAAESLRNEDGQQLPPGNIKLAIQQSRDLVNDSASRFGRKITAHQILSRDVGNNMPNDLANGLDRELKILEFLQQSNSQGLGSILDLEEAISKGAKQYSAKDVDKMIATISAGYDQLEQALNDKREQRRQFKKLLSSVIDTLMKANPGKIATYIQVKAELDPDLLDLEVPQQKLILNNLSTISQMLK